MVQPRATVDTDDIAWFPLLPAQMDMYVDLMLFPDAPTYTLCNALWFDGPLDPARFARAWNAMAAESESLRLRFVIEGGHMMQAVMPAQSVEVPFVDLSAEADPDAAVQARMEAARQRMIRPTDAALYETTLFRLAPDRHLALLSYLHLIADGAVRAQLVRSLAIHYRADGAATPPPPAAPGIADVSRMLATYRDSAAYTQDRAYWQARFADPPGESHLEIP